MIDNATLTTLTAEIAAGFLANNPVAVCEVAHVITSIHTALATLGSDVGQEPTPPTYAPAVSLRKSLADPTKIISMIDGKPYSMLKRHLALNGLTPAEYLTRYNLPASYPMTAPAYSEKRRALAQSIGLGRKPKASEPKVAPAPKNRGRKPKVAAAES